MRLDDVFSRVQRDWNIAANFAIWIVTLAAAVLRPPPSALADSSTSLRSFAALITTAISLLLIVFALKHGGLRYLLRWSLTAIVSVVFAFVTFFAYQVLLDRWTGTYMGHRVAIGSQLTKAGEKYVARHPEATPDQMIWDADGAVNSLWTRRSIRKCRVILSGLYVVTIPLFAGMVIAVVETVRAGLGAPAQKRVRADCR